MFDFDELRDKDDILNKESDRILPNNNETIHYYMQKRHSIFIFKGRQHCGKTRTF